MANWNPFAKPKHWTAGVKESISELGSKVKGVGIKAWSKVPPSAKVGLGVAGIAAGTVGVLAASIAVSPRLKPSDPKYKALREGGFITDKQHRKELAHWRKKKYKTTSINPGGKYSYDVTSYRK
tara:strand:+ start:537 stop:908 length:372 start_codon:yes stop_codon:yes gene_type:complete